MSRLIPWLCHNPNTGYNAKKLIHVQQHVWRLRTRIDVTRPTGLLGAMGASIHGQVCLLTNCGSSNWLEPDHTPHAPPPLSPLPPPALSLLLPSRQGGDRASGSWKRTSCPEARAAARAPTTPCTSKLTSPSAARDSGRIRTGDRGEWHRTHAGETEPKRTLKQQTLRELELAPVAAALAARHVCTENNCLAKNHDRRDDAEKSARDCVTGFKQV